MSERRREATGARRGYTGTAPIYDTLYAWKDYKKESRRVLTLLRTYSAETPRRLLDVACGTGGHLAYLSRTLHVTGLDQDAGMLRVARRRLPRVRFVRARMEEFTLPGTFDAITCLFSAIGYVRSTSDLRKTVRNFSAHLRPGGVAIVEPWLTPANYRTGGFHVRVFGTPEMPIVRMNRSERRGDRSFLRMHHLVATPHGIEHLVEDHDLGLFDLATYRAAFRSAGFRVRYLRQGLMPGRGLFVAVRGPARAGSPRGRPRRRTTRRSRSSPREP